MNTTTFTIESVHGVKQTFVLSAMGSTVGSQTSNDKSAPSPINATVGSSQPAPQASR